MLFRSIARILLFVLLSAVVVLAGTQRGDARLAREVSARPAPIPVPVVRYTMASPRAALIGPPVWSTNAYYLPSGGAENFARGAGSIRVRVGTRVHFCLSNRTEGVWYANSYGRLATSLVLQWCCACECEDATWKDCICNACDCEACQCAECLECEEQFDPTTDTVEDTVCPWITIGKDGAGATRKGPSIGKACVGVPVRFRKPGIYYLRGIVRTVAQPWYPLPLDQWSKLLTNTTGDTLPMIPATIDKDIVYVRVRVLGWPTASVEPIDEVSADPDIEYGEAIPREEDLNEPAVAELSGDELILQVCDPNSASGVQQDRARDMDQTTDGVMIRDRDMISRP